VKLNVKYMIMKTTKTNVVIAIIGTMVITAIGTYLKINGNKNVGDIILLISTIMFLCLLVLFILRFFNRQKR